MGTLLYLSTCAGNALFASSGLFRSMPTNSSQNDGILIVEMLHDFSTFSGLEVAAGGFFP